MTKLGRGVGGKDDERALVGDGLLVRRKRLLFVGMVTVVAVAVRVGVRASTAGGEVGPIANDIGAWRSDRAEAKNLEKNQTFLTLLSSPSTVSLLSLLMSLSLVMSLSTVTAFMPLSLLMLLMSPSTIASLFMLE